MNYFRSITYDPLFSLALKSHLILSYIKYLTTSMHNSVSKLVLWWKRISTSFVQIWPNFPINVWILIIVQVVRQIVFSCTDNNHTRQRSNQNLRSITSKCLSVQYVANRCLKNFLEQISDTKSGRKSQFCTFLVFSWHLKYCDNKVN